MGYRHLHCTKLIGRVAQGAGQQQHMRWTGGRAKKSQRQSRQWEAGLITV